MADIRHSIQISAKAEEIYPLVSTASGFGQWWATDIIESAGAVELGFFERATIYRLRLGAVRAPWHAEWVCESGAEWNGTRIGFEMEAAAKGGTVLRFTHGGWHEASEYFVMCNTTWGELMFRLKAAAEGKARGPLFSVEGMGY